MAPHKEVVVGARFGQWVVLEPLRRTGRPGPDRKGSRYTALCRCDCGTEKHVGGTNLGVRSFKCSRCVALSRVTGTGVSTDPLEVAWAAGFFEGEGSVYFYRGSAKSSPHPILSLASTDEDVLRRFQRIVGRGKVYGPYNKGAGTKPRFDWQTGSYLNCAEIMRAFLPYLGERRRAKAIEVLGEAIL